ncbi:hypothetical protein O3P69_019370 [Scylla paramamosain]|uniref:ADP-dependent glucokinase n=1 Tax=Scylla paramamosain TaxID=85552 RepID=A0AAW0SVG5_SCYPA
MATGKVLSVFSLVIIGLAIWLNRDDGSSVLKQRLEQVLKAMLEVEEQYPVGEVRIAVGYGACRDVFVQGAKLLGPLPPPPSPAHHSRINSLHQLKEVYAFFFTAGSAAERYVQNETLFREVLEAAEGMVGAYSAVGGNAPVMASRFAKEGAHVVLAAKRSPYLLKKLHPGVVVAGDDTDGTRDVHLILEYPVGDTWGPYHSPRANRFIIHSDQSNPMLSSVEAFSARLATFRPHLFVVGGLQMMDNFPFPPGMREERLGALSKQLASLSPNALIHFEMASFTEEALLHGLVGNVLPYSDSLGLNEQELPNLYNMLRYGNITLVSDYNPRVAVVLDQMRYVFRHLSGTGSSDNSTGRRHLSRLHLHTLAFQAIMVRKGSKWTNTLAAATKAALTANRHVCGNAEISLEKAKMLMDDGFTLSEEAGAGRVMFDNKRPVACWSEEGGTVEVCIAPVLVCTSVRHTAGGGDNISAAGLILQV